MWLSESGVSVPPVSLKILRGNLSPARTVEFEDSNVTPPAVVSVIPLNPVSVIPTAYVATNHTTTVEFVVSFFG